MVEIMRAQSDPCSDTNTAGHDLSWHIHAKLHFSMETAHTVQSITNKQRGSGCKWIAISIIQESDHLRSDFSICLEDIYRFDQRLSKLFDEHEGWNVVICAGHRPSTRSQAAMLAGCYLMLHGRSYDEVCSIFGSIDERLFQESRDLSLRDFCSAFHEARCMGWINFDVSKNQELGENELDIEEYVHYSRLPCATFLKWTTFPP